MAAVAGAILSDFPKVGKALDKIVWVDVPEPERANARGVDDPAFA
jgi:hypothetical protein